MAPTAFLAVEMIVTALRPVNVALMETADLRAQILMTVRRMNAATMGNVNG